MHNKIFISTGSLKRSPHFWKYQQPIIKFWSLPVLLPGTVRFTKHFQATVSDASEHYAIQKPVFQFSLQK